MAFWKQCLEVILTLPYCTTLALLPLEFAEELLSVTPDLNSCLGANMLCKATSTELDLAQVRKSREDLEQSKHSDDIWTKRWRPTFNFPPCPSISLEGLQKSIVLPVCPPFSLLCDCVSFPDL